MKQAFGVWKLWITTERFGLTEFFFLGFSLLFWDWQTKQKSNWFLKQEIIIRAGVSNSNVWNRWKKKMESFFPHHMKKRMLSPFQVQIFFFFSSSFKSNQLILMWIEVDDSFWILLTLN